MWSTITTCIASVNVLVYTAMEFIARSIRCLEYEVRCFGENRITFVGGLLEAVTVVLAVAVAVALVAAVAVVLLLLFEFIKTAIDVAAPPAAACAAAVVNVVADDIGCGDDDSESLGVLAVPEGCKESLERPYSYSTILMNDCKESKDVEQLRRLLSIGGPFHSKHDDPVVGSWTKSPF